MIMKEGLTLKLLFAQLRSDFSCTLIVWALTRLRRKMGEQLHKLAEIHAILCW